MYIVVDDRQIVTSGYVASFKREGVSSIGLYSTEFSEWLESASDTDMEAIQGFVLGSFEQRASYAESIRRHSKAPIIALSDVRSLEETLELFTAKFDDVVRKPVHVREILARSEAVWRRVNASSGKASSNENDRLKVFFDGRDPEIDGIPLTLPRRERHILEYLVRKKGHRLTKKQIFDAVYGLYSDDVEDSVVEGHISKLRKKLRQRLGYDPIDAKRYIGYSYTGAVS
ncbi:winged helix-turn-helix domain-containing protein [Microvirga sp. G4-2]|uniref:winged helix-turn-helix domain-containing protein n=1 Tax=Microvirga sp. G4-2 TaxID=3434467 RepID=UPI0040440A62